MDEREPPPVPGVGRAPVPVRRRRVVRRRHTCHAPTGRSATCHAPTGRSATCHAPTGRPPASPVATGDWRAGNTAAITRSTPQHTTRSATV